MELRETLIESGIATATQVDEAIARQVLYGLDFVTNLLEITWVEERRLVQALGQAYALPTAPPGELPYAAATAIGLVPKETAVALGVYPFRLDGGVLTVIAAEPLPADSAAKLTFALQVQLNVMAGLGPRVKQAIARDYAFALDRRTQKALAKLEKRPTAHSSRAPHPFAEGPRISELPRPVSVAPIGFPMTWSEAQTPAGQELLTQTARQPDVHLRQQLAADLTSDAPRASRSLLHPDPPHEVNHLPSGSNRRRGPYTAAQAKRDLKNPHSARRVLDVYFDYAAQFFDHSAIFSVHGSQLELRDVRMFPRAALSRGQLPLRQVPALETAASTRRWLAVELTEGSPLGALLGCDSPHAGLVLPISVHDRVVLLLLGAFAQRPVELSDVGEVLAFEALVAQALEHLILQKKAGGRRGPSPQAPSVRAPSPRFQAPDAAARAQALALALAGNAAAEGAAASKPNPGLEVPLQTTPLAAPLPRVGPDPLITERGASSAQSSAQSGAQSGGHPRAPAADPWTYSSQPPGAYLDTDEARDSGWDFDPEQ